MSGGDAERLWNQEAAGVVRRVNTGWWLERFNLLVVVALILFSVVILCLRTVGLAWMDSIGPLTVVGVITAGAALWAWLWSRSQFIGKEEALVRLDDRLKLNNGLSSALAKVAPWPVYESVGREVGLRWRWEMAILPCAFAAIMVVAAFLVPVIDLKGSDPTITHEPNAWGQMDEWVATLEAEDLIDPDSLIAIEEKIEELRQQPEEDWYGHASLEATDTLKDGLGMDLQELASEMATLERDLEALRSFSSEMSEAGKEMLLREMEEALKSLAANGLEVNSELASQLSKIDPSKLGQQMMGDLSLAELKTLQKQLCQGCDALGSMDGLPALSEDSMVGAGMCMGMGLKPGVGGISRGRGDAPLFFGDEDDLGTNRIEKVENLDFSNAAPGDLLGLGETEHDIDKNAKGPQSGGAVSSGGQGGDAVWRDSLLPDEKALLKRYFK